MSDPAAVVAEACSAAVSSASTVRTADLVVVGSGLAGLTTALRFLNKARLDATGKRPTVVILESDGVIGGRTRSTRLQSLPDNAPLVSYGGTWVILDNDDLIAISEELDWLPFQPKLLPNYSKGALNLGFVFAPYLIIKLWLLGKKIVESPLEESLLQLDATPLSVWVQANASDAASPERASQAVVDWFFQIENYPSDISRLSTYFAAKSIFVRLSDITSTGLIIPKIMRWQNGTGEITERMLAKIRSFGGDIIFHRQAKSIEQDETGVTTTVKIVGEGEQFETWRSQYIVVATALTNAGAITYNPPLPPKLTATIPALNTWDDPSLQIVFAFKTQWWLSEDQGASIYPAPIPDTQTGVYGPVFDLSESGPVKTGKKSKSGILRIICKSSRCMHPDGTRWTDDEIQASAFAYLARFHKKGRETEAQTIARIAKGLIQRWFFDFNTTPDVSAVTFFYGPTDDKLYATNAQYLREAFGRVHFAGSERANRGFNWMEGAALSGRQTALDVLHAFYGASWTAADDKAFLREIARWKVQGLARLKAQDIWDIPKYIGYLFEVAFDTIKHFFEHLFHLHEQPQLTMATINGAQAYFRRPETAAEQALLDELAEAVQHMPPLDRLDDLLLDDDADDAAAAATATTTTESH